jgi:hypothetical protein
LREIDREERDNIDYATHLLRVPQLFRPTINSEHTRWLWAPWGMWPEPLHPGAAATLERVEDRIEELLGNIEYAGGEGVAMDAEWREEDHKRGQPGNAGQFGPGGSSGESKNKSSKKEPNKSAKQSSVKVKPPSGSKEDNSAREELNKKTQDIVIEFYSANHKNDEERNNAHLQVINNIADHVYSYLGVDKNDVSFKVEEQQEFTVGNRKFRGAGSYNPDKKLVSMSKDLPIEEAAELIAHEVMHAKYNAVMKAFYEENDRHRAASPEDKKKIAGPDGKIRPEHQKDFPAHSILPKGWWNPDKLRKDDGITPYSKEWWKAEGENKANSSTAVNETLAEMAKLDWNGRLSLTPWFQKSKTYKPLYEAIHKAYPLVVGKEKAK